MLDNNDQRNVSCCYNDKNKKRVIA